MNAEQLLRHYDRVADAPDAVVQMRRLVLELAVRGKLVPQDRRDEPTPTLLDRINAERNRQIAAGEIRPSKAQELGSPPQPFSLPETWAWAALGAIFLYDAGAKCEPGTLAADFWLLELEDIEKDTGRLLTRFRVSDRQSQSTKSEFRPGDVLYGKLRPYLNKVLVANEPGYSTTEIVALRSYVPLCSEYCAIALRRPDFVDYVTRLGQGTKMPRLRSEDAVVAPFPLPPVPEQHRIVAKFNELMALCDRLETTRTKREAARDRLVSASLVRLNSPDPETFADDARFVLDALPVLTSRPDLIRQFRLTVLSLAVKGKLIAQDPDDEPATSIFAKIVQEQGRFVAGRKARRQTSRTPPNLDQAPFALPNGWAWARFPELGIFGRGKSKHRPRNDPSLFEGGTHLMIQTGDVARSKGVIRTFTGRYNDNGLAQSLKWPRGTLCITIAANIADSGILSFDACFPDSVVGFVPAAVFEDARYFEYFLRTAKANLLEFAPATAQKNINLEILESVLIPLPPLNEQRRIVARVDELMSLCDQLEASLQATTEHRSRLLTALLHDALASGKRAKEHSAADATAA